MTPQSAQRRTAATLVELLVVMSIIAALGAIALMMMPGITNSDATLKGAAEVQSALKISQAMAGSARLPRGVRLLVQPNSTICTEMQYLEAPPVMVPNPQVLVAPVGDTTYSLTQPRVELSYEFYNGTEKSIDPNQPNVVPPAGAIKQRHCYIYNLNADQASQVTPGATLVLPTLGAWTRIISSLTNNEVTLEVYPDALLGAASQAGSPPAAPPTALYRTYHFGIYGPPVPLLGEPTVQLPQNIAIDMQVSAVPQRGTPGLSYDILFAPSGQMITTYGTSTSTGFTGNSAVYLWVRDVSKVADMRPTDFTTWTYSAPILQFQNGGEQQIVGIRNGFVGSAPVLWPATDGTYSPGTDPFTLARQRLN